MLAVTLGLSIVGVLSIYSAGYRGPDLPAAQLWQQQIVWLILGLVGFFIVALLDYRWLCHWSWAFYTGAVGMLALTFLFGLMSYGAKRWLRIGSFAIQPSEFAKLALMLTLAAWLGGKGREPSRWRNVLIALALLAMPLGFILKQPDLGSAMVLVPVTLLMLFVARARSRFLLAILAGGLALTLLAYPQLKPYQQKRLTVFFQGTEDPRARRAEAWNLTQSKIAVGSGGLWGRGWRQGTQSRLGFLPVAAKDFIFAVFAEEQGFVGSALMLLAYALLFGLGLKTAAEATDRMGTLLATGVVTMLFTHVFVNIGMTIGLLPITGLPLPLVSYGGSFALTTMLALGLLQSVRLHRQLY